MPRVVPVAYDLERFLIASGMIGLTPTVREQYLDLDLAIDAAYEDFQRDTKIRPFLAESSNTTKYYDSQGGGYVQIHPYAAITSVYTKGSFETTSEAQTAVTGFEFVYDGDTIIGINFASYFRTGPGRIGVTGRRGWSDDLPANVFQALMGYAAGDKLQTSIASAIHNGALSWQEGDVSDKYGSMGAFSAQAGKWVKGYWEQVARYKQTIVASAGR